MTRIVIESYGRELGMTDDTYSPPLPRCVACVVQIGDTMYLKFSRI